MAKKKSNPECRRSLTERSELQKFVLHLLQGAMIGIGAVREIDVIQRIE